MFSRVIIFKFEVNLQYCVLDQEINGDKYIYNVCHYIYIGKHYIYIYNGKTNIYIMFAMMCFFKRYFTLVYGVLTVVRNKFQMRQDDFQILETN